MFQSPLIFYADGSLERCFVYPVHQMDLTDPDKPVERLVLYLSKGTFPHQILILAPHHRQLSNRQDSFRLLYRISHRDRATACQSDIPKHEPFKQFLHGRSAIHNHAEGRLRLAQSHTTVYHDRQLGSFNTHWENQLRALYHAHVLARHHQDWPV